MPHGTTESADDVWKIVLECGEQERHFNTLQGAYRALASTWLLAMFAGIGFLLNSNIEHRHLLISLTGLATTIGVFLLWFPDLCVYHRLLLAAFEEARILELQHPSLPPIRSRMRGQGEREFVRKGVSQYYIGIGCVSAAVCAGALAFWMFDRWGTIRLALSPALIPAIISGHAVLSVFGVTAYAAYHRTIRYTVPRPAEAVPMAARGQGAGQP